PDDVELLSCGARAAWLAGLPGAGGLALDAAVVRHAGALVPAPEAWERLQRPRQPADLGAGQQLWAGARAAKEQLSAQPAAALLVPLANAQVQVTRDEFDRMAGPALEAGAQMVQGLLQGAGVAPGGLAAVYLVGGGARLPLAAAVLHRALGVQPIVSDQPELVVAQGGGYAAPSPGAHTQPAPPVSAQPDPAPPTVATQAPVPTPPFVPPTTDIQAPAPAPPFAPPTTDMQAPVSTPPFAPPATDMQAPAPVPPFAAPATDMQVPVSTPPFAPPPAGAPASRPKRRMGVIVAAAVVVLVLLVGGGIFAAVRLLGDNGGDGSNGTPWSYTGNGELFQDTFDSRLDAKAWNRVAGNWSTDGESLFGSPDVTGWSTIKLVRDVPSDVAVHFRMKLDKEGTAEVMLRIGDGRYVRAALSAAGKQVEVGPGALNGRGTADGGTAAKSAPRQFATDRWYDVWVVAKGGHYQIAVDGRLFVDYSDDKGSLPSSGTLGFAGKDTDVYLDDLTVMKA
ncbi:family 16 glycoside hydrolase, partial [Dactylosporangium sp. NPDC051485]|uniref:family 16 glycoside hydrolase n=1 Tax=Dactylosporangium sp. NPDC051485 TaxID=3154846 RepID=UPI0034147CC1